MGRGIVAKKTAAIPRLGLNDILLSMSYKFNRGRFPPTWVTSIDFFSYLVEQSCNIVTGIAIISVSEGWSRWSRR